MTNKDYTLHKKVVNKSVAKETFKQTVSFRVAILSNLWPIFIPPPLPGPSPSAEWEKGGIFLLIKCLKGINLVTALHLIRTATPR